MSALRAMENAKTNRAEFVQLLYEHHLRSGLSLREVAQACDLDASYVHYILKGARKPLRDVIIALGFAYGLDRLEVDELLLLSGWPPIGRYFLREYRQANNAAYKGNQADSG